MYVHAIGKRNREKVYSCPIGLILPCLCFGNLEHLYCKQYRILVSDFAATLAGAFYGVTAQNLLPPRTYLGRFWTSPKPMQVENGLGHILPYVGSGPA